MSLALSIAIELLQFTGHPPSQSAWYVDLTANSASAALGAVIAAFRSRWMRLNARDATRLALSWSGMVLVFVALTAWLLALICRDQRDSAAPTVSMLENALGYPWFAGTVMRIVVSGVEVPH